MKMPDFNLAIMIFYFLNTLLSEISQIAVIWSHVDGVNKSLRFHKAFSQICLSMEQLVLSNKW